MYDINDSPTDEERILSEEAGTENGRFNGGPPIFEEELRKAIIDLKGRTAVECD